MEYNGGLFIALFSTFCIDQSFLYKINSWKVSLILGLYHLMKNETFSVENFKIFNRAITDENNKENVCVFENKIYLIKLQFSFMTHKSAGETKVVFFSSSCT